MVAGISDMAAPSREEIPREPSPQRSAPTDVRSRPSRETASASPLPRTTHRVRVDNVVYETGGSLVSTVLSSVDRPTRCGRRQRRAARRQLKRQDAVSSHLAELYAIRGL